MFQASHRKLAYVVCGQNRRRLLEASMGWYIRHHWHGMVWYGMAWQGTVKYDMVWQGMVCVDTSVTIAKTMSVIVIEDRSVARTVVLISKVLETPCFGRAHCRSCQCNVTKWSHFLKFWKCCSSEVILHWTCVRSNLLSSEPCNSIWSTQLAGSWQGAGTQALITRSKGGQRCPVDCPTQLIG